MKYKRCALASYPRSGNTWMRHLIHAATGIKSAYILNAETDVVHHAAAIPEIAEENSPIIKTHGYDSEQYDSVIHVVRNPWAAIASYLDYCQAFNVDIQRRAWFIEVEAKGWLKHAEYWRMTKEAGILPYHPVQYESLLVSPANELYAVLNQFLGVNVTVDQVETAVDACKLENLQAKGDPAFYPKGANRHVDETLTREEMAKITEIVSAEIYHWIS